ncbi:hypothetical protein LINPERPRIM_LOCUS38482, partial [Linum perenne]
MAPMTSTMMKIMPIQTVNMMMTTTPAVRMATTQDITAILRLHLCTRINSIYEEVRVLPRKQRHDKRPINV